MAQEITIEIATPKGVYTGTFAKTTKVESVITEVVQQMGLSEDESFDLVFKGEVLQPVQRPLVSFGIEDGAKLELVATGSGV